MMLNQSSSGPDLSAGNYKTQRRQGIVVGNGIIDRAMVATALLNPNPYYPLAVGSTAENINYVKTGDPVFRYKNTTLRSANHSYKGDYSKIPGVTNLNGLFTKGENHENMMKEIEFLGFAEMGTANNGQELYNIISGGSFTITNTGPMPFYSGDFGEIYNPSMEEVKNNHILGTKDEYNGEVTLRVRPFDPSTHSNTPKSIYQSLKKESNPNNQYRELANELIDSVIDMAIVILAGGFGTNLEADHILFQKYCRANREKIIEDLFYKYSNGELPKTTGTPFERDLDRMKRESIGVYMSVVGHFVDSVAKNVVFRATSNAKSGHQMNIQMRNYAM